MSIPTTVPETAGPDAESPPAPEPVAELEALRRERDELCAERDRIQSELDALRRGTRVRSLAEEHGFADPEYLDFLLGRRELEPDAPETGEFMAELKARSPKLFRVDLRPGAPVPAPQNAPAGPADRHAELIRRLENAPERIQ